MPIALHDALIFELRQRLTAATLQAGLLVRTNCYAETSLRLDALACEFALIAVLAEALFARTGRIDERWDRAGCTAIVGLEQAPAGYALAG